MVTTSAASTAVRVRDGGLPLLGERLRTKLSDMFSSTVVIDILYESLFLHCLSESDFPGRLVHRI